MIAIHAVNAIYDAATFNPNVRIQASQPIKYKCHSCPFEGNLADGVAHAVTNQFVVHEPVKERSND